MLTDFINYLSTRSDVAALSCMSEFGLKKINALAYRLNCPKCWTSQSAVFTSVTGKINCTKCNCRVLLHELLSSNDASENEIFNDFCRNAEVPLPYQLKIFKKSSFKDLQAALSTSDLKQKIKFFPIIFNSIGLINKDIATLNNMKRFDGCIVVPWFGHGRLQGSFYRLIDNEFKLVYEPYFYFKDVEPCHSKWAKKLKGHIYVVSDPLLACMLIKSGFRSVATGYKLFRQTLDVISKYAKDVKVIAILGNDQQDFQSKFEDLDIETKIIDTELNSHKTNINYLTAISLITKKPISKPEPKLDLKIVCEALVMCESLIKNGTSIDAAIKAVQSVSGIEIQLNIKE